MEYGRIEGEVLDYISCWDEDFDVKGIMEGIREENPDAATIDDIDPDVFTSILESNAL